MRRAHMMVAPPSTAIAWPVICRDASEERSTTRPFRSSSLPSRLVGVQSRISSPVVPSVARVIDEHIDPPEFLQHRIRKRRDRIPLADVADEGFCLHAGLFQVLDGLFEFFFLACGEGEPGAHLAQRLGHLKPEPARAARHERGLAFQAEKLGGFHPFSWRDLYSRNSSRP